MSFSAIFLPKRTYSYLFNKTEAIQAIARYLLNRDPSYKDYVTESTAEEIRAYDKVMANVFFESVVFERVEERNYIKSLFNPSYESHDEQESFFTIQKDKGYLIVYIDERFVAKSFNIVNHRDMVLDFYKQIAAYSHGDASLKDIHRSAIKTYIDILSNPAYLALTRLRLEVFL